MDKGQLERLHKVMQRALDEIDRVSGILGIRYYLIGGTLLGAVRHKGFIPWDDDLDVVMPRKDYNRFLQEAPALLSKDFFLQTRISDRNYGNMFSKVLVNNTAFVQSKNIHSNQINGIFVDIFPLDFGIPNPQGTKKIKVKIGKAITSYIFQKRNKIKLGKLSIFKLFPDRLLIRVEEYMYKGKGDYYINYGSQYGTEKQTIKITYYEPAIMLSFEGKQYSAPHDYKYILNRIYGKDYMALPPVEKRTTHNPVRLSFNTSGPDEVF